jgi:ubiquinone biosynthesis protein
MRGPHNIWRLIRTGATLERTGAMKIIMDGAEAPVLMRGALRGLVWPFQWLGLKGDTNLPPVTRALQALGPAYIKFGQVLSTRPDVVGTELAVQLRVLQDKLPPFPVKVAKAEIEKELGVRVDDVFADFSEPVAAASIAQVHKARLADGSDVAVKVLRPGIEKAFQKDIDAFYLAASVIDTFSPASRRLRPLDVIEHFEGVVLSELDLRLESASASEFADNTGNDAGFTLPRVRWGLSARRVMTLDWAEGINAADVVAIAAAGHDLTDLSRRVLQLFLNHALRDGFFHADMHHGNLKIAPNGDIIAVDFG